MRYLALLICLLTGCVNTSIKSLSKDYEVLTGTLSAPPQFGEEKDRLFLYLKIKEQVADKESILVAVLENTENKRILEGLAKRLNDSPNEAVYLYGWRNEGQWQEYITGVNFVVVAAGVYIPQTESYSIVLTDFGERGSDAFRSATWGGFIRLLGKAATKAL
jgi:hypothetical protein